MKQPSKPPQTTHESSSLRVSSLEDRCSKRRGIRQLLLFHALRPQDALIFLCDRPQAFVDKFLYALSAIGFSHVNVALRIRGDAVRTVEFARLPSALSECS